MLHFMELSKETHQAKVSDWRTAEGGILREKPFLRVLGPYDRLGRINNECWIGQRTSYVKIDDVKQFTEGKTKQCEMVIAGSNVTPDNTLEAPLLGVMTTMKLEHIAGQVIFSQFTPAVANHMSIGGKVHLRHGDLGVKTVLGLPCAGLTGLVEIVESAGLANTEVA